MKRYLAFFGEQYYPSQGMGDFVNDADTIDEAKLFIIGSAKRELDVRYYDTFDELWNMRWGCIYDTELRQTIELFDSSNFGELEVMQLQ